jgi:PHD/YefM family antitoxin component YafN of YafNO toxin-antitoxin module
MAVRRIREIKGRYVVDEKGKRVGVILDAKEYQRILDELEELEAIRAFDAARASGEKPVPFERAIAEIERKRK